MPTIHARFPLSRTEQTAADGKPLCRISNLFRFPFSGPALCIALCLALCLPSVLRAEQSGNETLDPGAFRNEAEQRLDHFFEALDRLNDSLQSQKGETQKELGKAMDDLADQMKTARREYDKLQKKGLEAWKQYQPEMERLLDELERTLEGTRSRMEQEQEELRRGGQVNI